MAYVYAGHYSDEAIDTAGRVLASTQVYVYLRGTATPASLYTSRTKGTAATNPVTTDVRGNVSFYCDPGDLYDLVAVVGGVAQTAFPVEVAPDPSEFYTIAQSNGTFVQLPQTADHVMYVGAGTVANDANDGLSPRSAKATVNAAIAALPSSKGKVIVGYGTFSAVTIPDEVLVEGVGIGTTFSETGVSIVTMTGLRSRLRDCFVTDPTGNAATIGVNIDNGATGVSQWRLDEVYIWGKDLGANNWLGIGLRCNFALKGVMNGGSVQFWNEGVHEQNSSNSNTFLATKIRTNNAGVKVVTTGSIVQDIFLVGCTLEGNVTGIDSDGCIVSLTATHLENNSGATPTNVRIRTGSLQSVSCDFNAAAAGRDVVIDGGGATHSSTGDQFNSGVTHNGTGLYDIRSPTATPTIAGTGPTTLSRPSTGFPHMTVNMFYPPQNSSIGATGSQGTGVLTVLPIQVDRVITLKSLSVNVTVAAAASAMRLGVYADNGTGQPGALLLDAGTVATTTTGVKTISGLTLLLAPGLYWLAAVPQGGTPTYNTNYGGSAIGSTAASDLFPGVGNYAAGGFYTTGITAALPTPFGAANVASGSCAVVVMGT